MKCDNLCTEDTIIILSHKIPPTGNTTKFSDTCFCSLS